jgi:CHAT domain-containing protein
LIGKERSPHATGLLNLLLGRSEAAVGLLERAAAEDPRSTAVFSDLAAAYLVRAETLDRPVDLIAALDAVERALELSPTNREALFNRALGRRRLSLSGQAEAWREYLRVEHDAGWAGEAKSALARLAAPDPSRLWPAAKQELLKAAQAGDQSAIAALAARFPQEARAFAEEEVLGAWAEHYLRGELSLAAADLAVARGIGQGLLRLSGESMLAETVAGLDQARREGRLPALADGLAAYREGQELVQARQFGRAEAPLERARKSLRQAASPFEAWASFLLLRCAYQRSDYADVERRAGGLLRRLDIAKYPVLAARTRWVLGTAQMSLARPAEALDSYRFALAQLERTRETVNLAAVHSLLATAFNELGDTSSAWQNRALALRGLADGRDPERLRIALTNVAFASLDAGYPRAARLLQTEAVEIARSQDHPERLTNSLLNRASILDRAALGDPAADLEAARRYCQRIEDSAVRQSLLSDLLAATGRCLSRRAPARSLEAFDEALRMYRAAGRRAMLPEVLRTRAAVLRSLGRLADAERDLRSAVEILEEERGSVPEAEQRASFSHRSGAVFDAMVRLQAERENVELAFEYSERRRARLLLDWLSAMPRDVDAQRFRLAAWTRPHPLRELQKKIPDGVAVIEYELLPDRLLVWLVRAGSVEQRQVLIPDTQVAERVRTLERATAGPEDRLRQAGAALHEVLIAPVAGLLRREETVVFIPESPLYAVPFGLLFDPRAGRFLIEDRPFAVAPSLSLFAMLAERLGPSDFSQSSVLALANPAFDRTLFDLPALTGAEEEGRLIRNLYPKARLVTAEAATREALLGGFGHYRLLHFGGHALANPEKPLLSSLLLAPGPDREDSGVVYAREVIGPRGRGTDLVVLSACRSAGGAAPAGEGVAGLIWPFFSRGASMVIASTRDVEDREAANLFARFYRRLAAGEAPVAALRGAQLETLTEGRRSGHPAFGWAAFHLYGAVPGTEGLQKGEPKPK